ncbi:MAG TPA: hypothetical protein VIY86_11630 [Pirellulaceae bacterium]
MRRIKISYEIVTPESAAEGCAAESGWKDENGIEIDPADYADDDATELEAVARLAVGWISRAVEPSSTVFHRGIWYTDADGAINFRTGAEERNSYHLDGFSEVEELRIFQLITGRE